MTTLHTGRFFLSQPLSPGPAELLDSEAHHLLHVLRAQVGDTLSLFNGLGDEATAEIVRIRKRSAELNVVRSWSVPEEPRSLTLAVALPKGDRARWLVEKLTELGVSRLIPLRTERSVVEPRESKLDKLEQTVIAACKQSGRSRLLQLSPLTSLHELLGSLRTGAEISGARFHRAEHVENVLHVVNPTVISAPALRRSADENLADVTRSLSEGERSTARESSRFEALALADASGYISSAASLKDQKEPKFSTALLGHPSAELGLCEALDTERSTSVSELVLIGPEGGFSPAEVEAAVAAGVRLVHFGPLVLRVETAALLAASAWRLR